MREKSLAAKSQIGILLLILITWVFAGCSTIKLVADYDENIDKGVTELQKKSEMFLVKLGSLADKPEGSYEKNKAFYQEVKVEISALRVRADAIQRNSLTVRMLDKLLNNIERLEADHKEAITPDEIPLYRGGLNSQFTSILTFELAKKRGEKPDEKSAAQPPTENSLGKKSKNDPSSN